MGEPLDERLASHLTQLRAERSWSMDDLAARSGISRSTLSRMERGETSPTATLLGKLATAYGLTISRLLSAVEDEPVGLIRAADQPVWTDQGTGLVRRSVSPPTSGMRAEVVRVELPAGETVAYDAPPVPGMEQHVWMLGGELELTVDGVVHRLSEGDCLRFHLWGTTRFRSLGPAAAAYAILVVLP